MHETSPTTLAFDDSDGFEIALRRRSDEQHGEVFELVVNGMFAMDSVDASSELELASMAPQDSRRVLVGGLGLGFTAAALLSRDPAPEVCVAELSGALVGWARDGLTPGLARVAGDPRCTLWHVDVAEALRTSSGWDAILLDVDNGPSFLIHDGNAELYRDEMLRTAHRALSPDGLLAIWCEQASPVLDQALRLLDGEVGTRLVGVDRDGHHIDYAIHWLRRVSPADGPRER